MKRKVSIILGAGFGDEGKGQTVYQATKLTKKPLVIRFNGGHQVGHTVVNQDVRHVFSNFGSGTLNNVPTYWSEYCTVEPIGVVRELEALRKLNINPVVIYNSKTMVTTPFDIYYNHIDNNNKAHGSVGVGFGKTIGRNEDHFHLYVRDLFFPNILDEKLRRIAVDYYRLSDRVIANLEDKISAFKIACKTLTNEFNVVNNIKKIVYEYDHLIFEGGQGILLDMDYGFFPNVTRSNTTSKNVMKILEDVDYNDIHTYYVTRAYQTRHGNGYMTNTEMDCSFIDENPYETNVYSEFQGNFRKSVLDLDLLQYAIDCDNYYNNSTKHLVITCLDQVPLNFPMTWKETRIIGGSKEIAWNLGFSESKTHVSYSDGGVDLFK